MEGMIKAERDFAAHSVANGTKAAFLAFADSTSLLFDRGNPVKATLLWAGRVDNGLVLGWQPELVEMAASGDLGYSAGPWTLRTRKSDSVLANGYFITVWTYTQQQTWRFRVDLGITCNGKIIVNTLDSVTGVSILVQSSVQRIAKSAGNAETRFVRLLEKRGSAAAYRTYLSEHSSRYVSGQCLVGGKPGQTRLPDSLEKAVDYQVLGGGTSTSGDLAYTYGSVRYKSRIDNYLRIWRREKNGWKIAVEVLRY